MIKRITGRWMFYTLVSILIYMVCTEYPNPFLDQSLSKAAIDTKTFQNGDTVLIFSSETISVVTYLREHIKEVAVHIDNNRFWKNDNTFFYEEDLTVDPIVIPISFFRTGWNKIIITTTFKNDETRTEIDSLFARSPLFQTAIVADPGDMIHLQTDSVKDNDVNYIWDFGDSMPPITSLSPQSDFVLKFPFSKPTGELYVQDRKLYRSPKVKFGTTAGSEAKLIISTMNVPLHGDTIYTGESNFTFKILVNGTFKSASVNGLPFDDRGETTSGIQLSKTFNNLDTLSGPMKATVKVEDKSNESTEKIFFIKYDRSTASPPKISVTFPITIKDTALVKDSIVHLSGEVTGHAQYDKLFIKFSRNGFAKGYYILLAENNKWTYTLNLVSGWNKVRMDLSKDSISSSSIIVSKEIQIKCDSTMKDVLPPKIMDYKVNGTAIAADKRFISNNPSSILTMVVLDINSIKSVTVNKDTARVQEDGKTYSVSITPEHKFGGTQFIITAMDADSNVKRDTLTGTLNHSPRIDLITIPSSMIVDSTYYFVVKASDGDAGDKISRTITITRSSGDTSITLVTDSVLWKPSLADTGKYTILVSVEDDFFDSKDTTLISLVNQKTDKPPKVSWLTTTKDFPDSITNNDKLTIPLKVTPNTGSGPFTYTVSIYDPHEIIYKGNDSQFSWAPTRSDAGVRTLRFIVSDKNDDSDTLDVLMTIIARPSAVISFADQSMIIDEKSTTAAAIVRLNTPLADSVKVPYTIKFQSATSEDLTMNPSGVIWFAPGDTTVRLPINVVNDSATEKDDLFTIELSDLPVLSDKDSIAINKNKSIVEVTIRDDDQRPVKYSFVGSAASGSEGSSDYTIKVTLDTPLDKELNLKYDLDKDLSTVNENDFAFGNSLKFLIFKPGVTEADFKIIISPDTEVEKDEVLVFKIVPDDPSIIPGENATFQYTIIDDDAKAKVGVMLKPETITLPEGAIPNIGIVLTATLKDDLRVTIRAKETSTARAGPDYTIGSNFIVVKATTTSQSMGLKVVKNNFPEPPKFVEFEIIAISDTVNAEISSEAKTMIVTITD